MSCPVSCLFVFPCHPHHPIFLPSCLVLRLYSGKRLMSIFGCLSAWRISLQLSSHLANWTTLLPTSTSECSHAKDARHADRFLLKVCLKAEVATSRQEHISCLVESTDAAVFSHPQLDSSANVQQNHLNFGGSFPKQASEPEELCPSLFACSLLRCSAGACLLQNSSQ